MQGTEKDHRQLHLVVEAAMSSRSSRGRSKNALAGTEQLSFARHELTQSLSLSEEKVDPAAAPTEYDVAPQSTRSKASLMKKLSLLLHPRKSKSKSGNSTQKPLSPSTHASAAGAGRELELLFAQAEATLGELLVRAGASFDARSSSSHVDHPSHVRGRSNGGAEAAALIGSSSGRSAGLSTQGHARRKSLSRVWQQLGGSLFCGSGHMSGYVMEEMPLPGHTSTYSGNHGVYEDVVLDEAYWQSLADAMLMQRQQQHQHAKLSDHEAKLPADNSHHHEYEDISQLTKEVQVEGFNFNFGSKSSAYDLSVLASTQQQPARLLSGGVSEPLHVSDEEADRESEIVPSIDVGSMCKWAVCGSTSTHAGRSSLDMDSMYYRNFIGVEGGGSTRLNTTLEDSPNLAHSYQLHMKMGGAVMSSSCTSVVELLNYYSFPAPVAEAPPRLSSQVETPLSMQPLEKFLWQARRGAGTGISSEEAMSTTSPYSRSAPELTTCQEPAAVELSGTTTSCRVSLMTLLHEEAAAIDSPATSSAFEARQEEEDEAAAEEGGGLQGRRRLVADDPLLCCVCMVRRKGAALIPCGHTFCRICSKQLFAGRGACPLCNNLIVQVLDIF